MSIMDNRKKLDRDEEIIKLYKQGFRQVDIARKYKISRSRINQIISSAGAKRPDVVTSIIQQ